MLLTDLHIHSNFSDGRHSIHDIVDIYGNAGFDAIAITDHLAETNTLIGKITERLDVTLTKKNFDSYIETIEEERERAWRQYGMIVVTGFEITKNNISPLKSSHIVALDVKEFLSAEDDSAVILKKIRSIGGLGIAAHPLFTRRLEPQTFHLWLRRKELRHYVDAWEIGNGWFFSKHLSKTGLPVIANSDFHYFSQLTSWKTLVDAKKNKDDILDGIRRQKVQFIFYKAEDKMLQPVVSGCAAYYSS